MAWPLVCRLLFNHYSGGSGLILLLLDVRVVVGRRCGDVVGGLVIDYSRGQSWE